MCVNLKGFQQYHSMASLLDTAPPGLKTNRDHQTNRESNTISKVKGSFIPSKLQAKALPTF